MNSVQARVYALQAVKYEREEQDKQWGGSVHDDDHSESTWTLLLAKHVGRLAGDLTAIDSDYYDRADIYRRIIVIAALALAFAEWQNRRRSD